MHFFETHHMNNLIDRGPEDISKWLINKNINVFRKKLLFIVINANGHWSLLVVVNSGLITRNLESSGERAL